MRKNTANHFGYDLEMKHFDLAPNIPILQKVSRPVIALLIAIALIFTVFLTVQANSDLIEGRFALFMDERITVDGVQNILHPKSYSSFVWSIKNGGDQRYGRVLWNATAALSWLPEAIWGLPGQIVAGRMAQALFLISAVLLISFSLIQTPLLRLTFLCATLWMPFSSYYLTMPKPEPLQLLFFSLFLVFYIRSDFQFGRYWAFLGLAFGAKISILPAVLVFGLASLAQTLKQVSWQKALPLTFNAFAHFSLGVGFAVPILLKPAFGIWISGQIVNRLRSRPVHFWTQIFFALLIPLWALIANQSAIQEWLAHTFLTTGHGVDQARIGLVDWALYFDKIWLQPANLAIPLAIALSMVLLLVISISILFSGAKLSSKHRVGLTLIVAGLFSVALIFLSVKRLWGFYLFPSLFMIIAGMFLLLDSLASSPLAVQKRIQLTQAAVVMSILALVYSSWLPKFVMEMKTLASRSESAEHRQNVLVHNEIIQTLGSLNSDTSRPLRVLISIAQPPPERNAKYQLIEFAGHLKVWNREFDAIVLGPHNTPSGKVAPSDSLNYQAYLAEREEYSKHVSKNGAPCASSPCYSVLKSLSNGGEVLILQ